MLAAGSQMAKKQRPARKVKPRSDGLLAFSLTRLARELGISRDRLAYALHQIDATPIHDTRGNTLYRLRDVVAALSGASAVERMSPFKKLAHIKAQREEIALRQQAGELVPVAGLAEEIGWVVKQTVQVLSTLPDVCERDCGASPAVVERVEQAIDALRVELHGRMAARSDAPAATTDQAPAEVPA